LIRPPRRRTAVDHNIRAFLNGLSPEVRDLVSAVRRLVCRTIPQAEESVVWGSLSYHRPEVGGRVKGAVCLIVAKKGQVRLDFIHGIRLPDPSGLLRGHQVSKRCVPIRSREDVDRPEVAFLIREAAALDPAEPAGQVAAPGRARPTGLLDSSSRRRRGR
jgi:hypothetical protein